MALLRIRTYPDPVLKEVCAPVQTIDDRIRRLLQDMAETMYAANGVGLAAPQVGERFRIIVVDAHREDRGSHLLKLVNPVIKERSGRVPSSEGCLSLPDLTVELERDEKVVVEALLPDGSPARIEADGLLSIALQHEIDHLDGVLLVDRLSSLRRNLYLKRRIKEKEEEASPAAV
ncbi:MAG: peptide deformylase [bacterium]